MNRQAANPGANFTRILQQPNSNETPPATKEERVGELMKSHGQALCKQPRKKELANSFILRYPNIKSDVATVDPNEVYDLAIKLAEIHTKWKTKNKINHMKNEDLATVLVALMSVVEVLDSNLREIRELEATTAAVSRNTRRGNAILPTTTQVFYQTLMDLRRDVDVQIAAGRGGNASNPILKGLNLLPAMIGRHFKASRIPTDEAHRKCPWCQMFSVMTCEEDDNLLVRNGDKGSAYDRRTTAWVEYQLLVKEAENHDQEKPPHPTDPVDPTKKIKRAPQKPKLDKLRLLCTSINSVC